MWRFDPCAVTRKADQYIAQPLRDESSPRNSETEFISLSRGVAV